MPIPQHTTKPPPPSILLFLRFLYPASLLFASCVNFSLPSLPFFFLFLFHHRRPSFSIKLSRFPIISLLSTLIYSFLGLLTHITLALLIQFQVFDLRPLSQETCLSLAIPRYDESAWQGLRFLIPFVVVLISSLLPLLARVPSQNRYAGSRFISAWFRRRKRQRSRASSRRPDAPRSILRRSPSILRAASAAFSFESRPDPDTSAAKDFASVLTDDDVDIGMDRQKKQSFAGATSVSKFTAFMADKGGIFWCSLSIALVGVSYSSLLSFVFLAVFLTIVLSWAFNVSYFSPSHNPERLLLLVRIFRIYVYIYLIVLAGFQIPWLIQYGSVQKGDVALILKFVGLVPINTSKSFGWTAVMAFATAISTYIFTGIFAMSHEIVHEVRKQDKNRGSWNSQTSAESIGEGKDGMLGTEGSYKPSYYEEQFLLIMMHASALGLLSWALVFPGILTLPLLASSILYLSLRRFRKSRFFNYVLLYAFCLELVHYIFIAVDDAFLELSEQDNEESIVRLLGLRSIQPQFVVNLIEAIAIAMLCVNIFGRRYIDHETAARSAVADITHFVQSTLFRTRDKKRDSLYSPVKLVIDQMALASLYVTGGLELTALNSIFLIALSAICILQSFGLFRRPKIFSVVWCAVLIYSIGFLLTTATFCRATTLWEICEKDVVGVHMASPGQVVSYAITVVLGAVQVNFTWAGNSVDDLDYKKEFQGWFWGFLRSYFLYVAYGALLLYPLLFPANFLSYGYVVFLFLSIVLELMLPSLQGDRADVRRYLKKYWILVIGFSCAAMLSRYFIRLKWFEKNPDLQRWFFGLIQKESRTFVVTIGDAIVLIVMSLQGRLFVVDSLVAAAKEEDINTNAVRGTTSPEIERELRDALSEPSDLASALNAEIDDQQKHRRYKSVELFLQTQFEAELQGNRNRRMGSSEHGMRERQEPNSSVVQETNTGESTPIDGSEDHYHRRAGVDPSMARVEQMFKAFRNLRKTVAVKQTEKFLYILYSNCALLIRNGLLRYSYVLQAVATLAASVWLPRVSLFGAVYILLGSINMLVEQPSFTRGYASSSSRSTPSIAMAMPGVFIILSFTLMSAQYIFLITAIIRDTVETSATIFIGLQKKQSPDDLPITVEAVLAHVIVFITAVVQKIAVRWGRMNAEQLNRGEMFSHGPEHPLKSDERALALDRAVPIGAVVKGVGGVNPHDGTDQKQTHDDFGSFLQPNWAENRLWMTQKQNADSPPNSISPGGSDGFSSSKTTDEDNNDLEHRIEIFRKQLLDSFNAVWTLFTKILSLLQPFWREWGIDLTLMYLVVCSISTMTVFSVIDIVFVAIVGILPRHKVRHRWHHVCLLLVSLTLAQYLLALGAPTGREHEGNAYTWRSWLFLHGHSYESQQSVSISLSFIALILAGITLNAIVEGPRGIQFWVRKLHSGHSEGSSSLEYVQRNELFDLDPSFGDLNAPLNQVDQDIQDANAMQADISSDNYLQYGDQPIGDMKNVIEDPQVSQPTLTSFISGLGRRGRRSSSLQLGQTSGEDANLQEDDTLLHEQYETDRAWESAFQASKETRLLGSILRPPMGSRAIPSKISSSSKSSFDIEREFLRSNDPNDFTRKPISTENLLKLMWMRCSGPLLQLYVFAVATVETNVISAVLLAVAFSFLFQFTNTAAKKTRFLFLRIYLIFVIVALVIFQAPFEVSSSRWGSIVGLYKKDRGTVAGGTFIYLIVSLWILCQIQGRVYESNDFKYVEKYMEEDAKVRFKRAVHEHNSRKYEKLLERNKAERSHYARKARLQRLKTLKESKRSVDAFYKVCVVDEVNFLKKQVDGKGDDNSLFATYRLLEDEKKENVPTGLNKLARQLMRGKSWQEFSKHTLSSEAKSFVFRYSAWPVYCTMLLAAIANPSITTVIYPLVLFLYLIVEQPRPPKHAWTLLMVYVCFIISFKYVFRNPYVVCEYVPFFGLPRSSQPQSVRNFLACAPAAGIGYDIFVLLALLGHRAVLYSRGVWDLTKSEEDMVLRGEIRGEEVETPPEMMYNGTSDSYDEKKGSRSRLGFDFLGLGHELSSSHQVWKSDQQCQDAIHVLNKAQTDIIGGGDVEIVPPGERSSNDIKIVGANKPPEIDEEESAFHASGPKQPARYQVQVGIKKRSVPSVPQSAPPMSRSFQFGDRQASPSVQGSDGSHGGPSLRDRFRTFRIHRKDPHSSSFMTREQSRVHDALSNVLPHQTSARHRNDLMLFNVQQHGAWYRIRQYFIRLTKENDHKAVGDYYLLIFSVDFISFIFVMFGFSAIFGDATSGRQETWWTTNFIETRHLLTLLAMFIMIILDRVCYLTRSMIGKLLLQYSSVFVYHIIIFVVQDYLGRAATRVFYILRCIYFLLSGLQIRDGFPMYTTAQFLLRNFTTFGIVLFEIYIFVPFLWLTRTLLDWAVLPTSLEIFQYFRFMDIYMWLYRNRAVNRSRGGFRRTLGQRRNLFPRIYQGFGLFLLCVLALFLPFIIFSIFNPFFVRRQVREAQISVDLITFDQQSTTRGVAHEIYRRTAIVGEPLNLGSAAIAAMSIDVTLDLREKEKIYETWFSAVSDTTWQLIEKDKQTLIKSLRSFSTNETIGIQQPALSFALSATTKDRVTFGARSIEFDLNRSVALQLAEALENGRDSSFAVLVDKPLPRYFILQSGATNFEVYDNNEGGGQVCVRLIQGGVSFWTVSDCSTSDCVCDTASNESSFNERQHLLQIADVSSLQVGGATILTLYTAILFTIGNLMKRMFIDKRLIIPYIDMPYTLHLYQLVLDIMYARQDEQLEMEEILYNGLIDIYRDQRELVRWTGERALKLPEEWWDRNLENPFMVYPSFAQTATEPYLDRIVE